MTTTTMATTTTTMAQPTKKELRARIDESKKEHRDLQTELQEIDQLIIQARYKQNFSEAYRLDQRKLELPALIHYARIQLLQAERDYKEQVTAVELEAEVKKLGQVLEEEDEELKAAIKAHQEAETAYMNGKQELRALQTDIREYKHKINSLEADFQAEQLRKAATNTPFGRM